MRSLRDYVAMVGDHRCAGTAPASTSRPGQHRLDRRCVGARDSSRPGIADRDARDRCLRWGWRQSRRLHVYGADMLAHNRGSGRGDFGGFLHIRIGLDTSRDKSGQGGNTTEPYQERTDYWGRFERRLWNQARIIGKLALQRQHGAVPAELGFEFSRAHFNRRTSACPR